MPTPKELHQAIIESRAGLQAAFHDAHDAWERKPQGGEGEDPWSPRQVAEHVIGAETFFASLIAQACGAPALERPSIDASTPATAAASLTRTGAIADNIFRRVTESDLPRTQQTRMGEMSVERMMQLVAGHGQDHANQIRACAQ